jgi:ABC-type branched-subunit amino acid transport system substrate-binding protein
MGEDVAQKINANGGSMDIPSRWILFDGNDKVDEAQAQALKIVEEDRALVVIGHRNSAASGLLRPSMKRLASPRSTREPPR